MAHDTIPGRLFAKAAAHPEHAAYYVRSADGWRMTTYAAYAAEVRQAARALIALGCEPGHTLCILGFNRPEWTVMQLASMTAGGAPAGIFTTCSSKEVQYIVDHSGSAVVLVENLEQWEKVRAERARLPRLRHVVLMQGTKVDDPLCMTWEEFCEKGSSVVDKRVDERLEALAPSGLATLIYTSGTTGPPKGVMLTHENLAWTATLAVNVVGGTSNDRSLSYLPLSHIAEQVFTVHSPITAGMSVYFAESIDRVAANLVEVRPTVFFGVPRIWEKFHEGISRKLQTATGAKKALLTFARRVGTAVMRVRATGKQPSGLLALEYALAKRLVFNKLKEAVGLGDARFCLTGAAPIGTDVLEFFASLDVLVLEVYGQSEDTGPTTINMPNKFRFGTVGSRIPGVEVRIADDGEILVRAPSVFAGYFKDESATRETLTDDWLHSGDLGEFDADGFLKITGRKKEIIVTAGGKNVAPRNIEAALQMHPLVGDAVVIGDRRKYLTCLITLEPEAAKAFAAQRGIDPSKVHGNADLLAEIARLVERVNADVGRANQLKKFHILPRVFSVEDGELTPTLKIKRRVIADHFTTEIEAMYNEPSSAVP